MQPLESKTFRPVRKLDVKEEDNFYIDKSDSIAESLITNLGFLKMGTIGDSIHNPYWRRHRADEYYAGGSK